MAQYSMGTGISSIINVNQCVKIILLLKCIFNLSEDNSLIKNQ